MKYKINEIKYIVEKLLLMPFVMKVIGFYFFCHASYTI